MACPSSHCEPFGCENCVPHDGAGIATPFPTAVPGITVIDADDITNLRSAINAERTRRSTAVSVWTDDPLVVGGTDVKALHFTEVKDSINGADQYPTQPCTAFVDPATSPDVCSNVATDSYSVGVVSIASDPNNLRGWVNSLELACVCDSDCGADNYCACHNNCGCNYP